MLPSRPPASELDERLETITLKIVYRRPLLRRRSASRCRICRAIAQKGTQGIPGPAPLP